LLDLEVELNTCGNELILILSKCKRHNELANIDNDICLNWNKVELSPFSERLEQPSGNQNLAVIDPTITCEMKTKYHDENNLCVNIVNEESNNYNSRCSPQHEASRDNQVDSSFSDLNSFGTEKFVVNKNCNQDLDKSNEYCKTKTEENHDSDTEQQKFNEIDSESSIEADDSCLGCVCGVTHKRPIPVFWIQCDYCDLWYNSSPVCLGFDEDEAKKKSTWKCPSCVLCDDRHDICKNETDTNWKCKNCNLPNSSQRNRCKACYSYRDEKKDESEINSSLVKRSILPVGTVVDVAKRTWPGMNKLGGVARITDCKSSNGTTDVLYSVRYILENKRELDIAAKYVSVYRD